MILGHYQSSPKSQKAPSAPDFGELPVPNKRDRLMAIVIGTGIALSPIHNRWLSELVTKNDEVGFFIPAFGYAIWIIAVLMYLTWEVNWKKLDWGSKEVFIPLLVIVGGIGLSGITADGWIGKFTPLLMGVCLFSLYLVSRRLGKDIFLPLAIGVAIASLGIILHGILYPGQVTGGFIFERNFDIATGFILLGAALFIHRWQWLLAGLALIAMLFSGAPEAVGVLVVLGLVMLLRRDWSRRLVAVLALVAMIAVIGLTAGWGQKLYSYLGMVLNNEPVAHYVAPDDVTRRDVSPLEIRILVIRDALVNLKPLGEGYNLTEFTVHVVHNVPLVIVQQLGWPGILAGLAWMWVSIWCLVKTKWKYAWVMIFALSLSDHFIWTQLCPFFWALVGVSTSSTLKSDLIFKKPRLKA